MDISQSPRGQGRDWRYYLAVAAVVVVALVLRALAYSPWDQHHADEFYQYLEQANRLITGYGIIPWESRFGIRNSLIPQFLAAPIWLGDRIAPMSMLPIHLARLSFAALCCAALAGAWGIGTANSKRHGLVALFVLAVWYDSVEFSVLLLSESIATAAIACGVALCLNAEASQRRMKAAGFLLMLGILLRFQFAPFVAAFVLLTAKFDWRTWRNLAIGALAAAVLCAISDMIAGQTPMAWIFHNFRMNISEGRAAEFGEEESTYYLKMIALALGSAFPAVLAFMLLAGRRYWPLIVALTINIAMHSLIGHKEYRFIWLSVFMILVLAAIGSVNLAEWLIGRRHPGRCAGWLILGTACAAWFGLSRTALNAEGLSTRLKLTGGAISMAAHDTAAYPRICGVGVSEDSSGYVIKALLRRDLPIYVIPLDVADGLTPMPPNLTEASNAVIATDYLPFDPHYEKMTCHHRGDVQACLLIRPGGCKAHEGKEYELQGVTIRAGM